MCRLTGQTGPAIEMYWKNVGQAAKYWSLRYPLMQQDGLLAAEMPLSLLVIVRLAKEKEMSGASLYPTLPTIRVSAISNKEDEIYIMEPRWISEYVLRYRCNEKYRGVSTNDEG